MSFRILFFLQLIFGIINFSENSLFSQASPTSDDNLSKHEMKILVLIIASDQHPCWKELQNIWRSYMHFDPEHVEVYFLKMNPDLSSNCEIVGDTIWCKGEENFIPGILDKTILSMEKMMPRLHEFDYVIRTNISSFYHFPRLLKYLEKLPKEKCYTGLWYPNNPSMGWVSGAGIIFSPDLIQLMVQNKHELLNQWMTGFNDDGLIWLFLKDRGIHKVKDLEALPLVIQSIEEWEIVKNSIDEHYFHFRIKNCQDHLRERDDVLIHQDLVNMFYYN